MRDHGDLYPEDVLKRFEAALEAFVLTTSAAPSRTLSRPSA
ncbi:hypothetical protein [Deinococcus hopiensis]|uniref:Uncharacterized protein n=1 Tax=Deinococcus hopiensis KR-140 TaxID=695939 RepID=A0A1W1UVG5_9DEIO|nr:hypothetical protein [Deinococcus hopiensis]SMB85158.1 hypothetical protein SAMN00790413_03290 [Deinococcus hopiensis KR-140]